LRYLSRTILLTVLAAGIFLLAACKGKENENKVIEDVSSVDTTYKVYYVEKDNWRLAGETWEYQSVTTKALVGECLDLLAAEPDEKKYRPAIEAPLAVEKYEFDEKAKQVNVFFNDAYKQLGREQELFCRAAIVKTLTQFDSVIDYVQFFADGQPLRETDGRFMVMMQSDFVDSTSADLKNLNEGTLKLYFASTDGLQLAREDVYVHYYNTSPVERVVMESLRSGPLSESLLRTFPEDTKIYKTTVSEGTCYVDVNQRFLEETDSQNFKVKVYSIVNSLCELDNVERVQILIDGQVCEYEENGVSISGPLSADTEIVVKPSDTPPALENAESESADTEGSEN